MNKLTRRLAKLKDRGAKIASLSPLEIQKLRDYEKEMNVILVAYQKNKEGK